MAIYDEKSMRRFNSADYVEENTNEFMAFFNSQKLTEIKAPANMKEFAERFGLYRHGNTTTSYSSTLKDK